MTFNLETISVNGKTCIKRIFAMRSAYVPEEKVKCRNCFDNYQEKCPEYVPANRTSIPIRRGYFANGVKK